MELLHSSVGVPHGSVGCESTKRSDRFCCRSALSSGVHIASYPAIIASVPCLVSTSGAVWNATLRTVTTTHWAPAGVAGAVQFRVPVVVPPKKPAVFVPVSVEVRLRTDDRSTSRTPAAGHGETEQR